MIKLSKFVFLCLWQQSFDHCHRSSCYKVSLLFCAVCVCEYCNAMRSAEPIQDCSFPHNSHSCPLVWISSYGTSTCQKSLLLDRWWFPRLPNCVCFLFWSGLLDLLLYGLALVLDRISSLCYFRWDDSFQIWSKRGNWMSFRQVSRQSYLSWPILLSYHGNLLSATCFLQYGFARSYASLR